MNLQNQSLQLMKELKNNSNYEKWCEWWSLSGIDDIAILPQSLPFKYVLKTEPFDYWSATFDENYFLNDLPEYEKDSIKSMIECIKNTIITVDGECPHKIAFTSIPAPCGNWFELVGLAKIDKDGISYVFSNDLDYLKFLKLKGL